MQSSRRNYLRTLLILGRVSNLPTIWSNCLAGWLLAGGGDRHVLLLLCFGATFLYLGGMYLNDAFDAQFDQQHRAERPIPSGLISVAAVWQWGLAWLAVGLVSLGVLGPKTALLASVLAVCILVYDAVHKIFALSPVLMATCRFLLVLTAASTGHDGVTGLSIWSALVLASYVVGLSFLARKESIQSGLAYWPCVLLAGPVVLALIVNRREYQARGILISAILFLWILRCLRPAYWSRQRNIGRAVAGLLAGIVLVDYLSIGGSTLGVGLIFCAMFGLALLFQRFIPAT
jgi:4-hydroxybenzoate polyprenyltransferase